MAQEAHETASAAGRLADWVEAYRSKSWTAPVLDRTRVVLLDSIGCALAGLDDTTSAQAIAYLRLVGGNPVCSVLGTDIRTSLPSAVFGNAVLIRSLDLNDSYAGPGFVGHPSDIVAAALSAAEMAGSSGNELLSAIRLGYEIYGRILDLMDAAVCPWDHTSAASLSVAAMTGFCLRLERAELVQALSMAATHGYASREARGKGISSSKTTATAVVSQTAAGLTLMAREGMSGPRAALEGPRGFASALFKTGAFDDFFGFDGTTERVSASSLKLYPCFAIGQSPIYAAVRLRREKSLSPNTIRSVQVSIADSAPARLRLADSHGRRPESREAADHSLHALVALALADGHVSNEQMFSGRWRDSDVLELIEKIDIRIDPTIAPGSAGSFPCRIDVELDDGSRMQTEQDAAPGHHSKPLEWVEAVEKFRLNANGRLSAKAMDELARCLATAETLENLEAIFTLTRSN
ncbi:MAG: 2-methylcitrate dehydratase [Hyphomicrobiales bacterium]|nr:2-methylcitrate dehydratase [Hyphomicrobiales bacterium]